MKDHLIPFKQLFANNRQFIVPEYQRGYSWEEKQRTDLLEDIERVYESENDYMHFTGTIVAAQNEDSGFYEIVDGQQRLTSLFMLCKVLNDDLNRQDLSAITSEEESRLKLNKQTNRFFKEVVFRYQSSDPETKSELNILNAWNEFTEWQESRNGQSEAFANIILERLGFLLYVPEATKETGIMFEVINNRGKPLSQLEKVKNYLTYYAQVEELDFIVDRISDDWPKILKNLSKAGINSNDDENAFLRYCWICFHSKNKNESYHVYEHLKERFEVGEHSESKKEDLQKFLNFLLNCSNYYVELFDNDQAPEPIKQLRHHPQNASVMPLYLSICEAFTTCKIDNFTKDEVLTLLEKVNFRIYVCPDVTKRSDTHQGKFFGDARTLFKIISTQESISVNKEIENLVTRLKKRIKRECNTKVFVQSLTLDLEEDFDYGGWNGLEYFLANYEMHINNDSTVRLENMFPRPDKRGNKPDDKFSKEHLWGKKNRAEINDRYEDKHEKWRLGNFVLLEKGINSKGNKRSLKNKLDIYYEGSRHTSLQMVWNLKDIFERAYQFSDEKHSMRKKNFYLDLYKKINDIREEKMVNFALYRWGIGPEKDIHVKIDSFSNKVEEREDRAVYQIKN